jgi:hypothetical protein
MLVAVSGLPTQLSIRLHTASDRRFLGGHSCNLAQATLLAGHVSARPARCGIRS